ncbi:hypothetical protein HYPBUDRAFT_111807 [Hyphopichia burtonii NRRL Y-1933]|uniref:Uncharacterized protein n=1 Tax=Hyphopichia burtonii NRRL Y-1933 TaxID=984485 RepID=A0A1E4RGK4_9ASCO|nr:hypothetical protein HYPBUDRAFT_111807 [Hyphopichia burtonii NRRL Y-1933]ODV66255.1 hypothetical protein HYPBUDRAFT_111807 [Hyphopichia burtonii NRRL Y-1933]
MKSHPHHPHRSNGNGIGSGNGVGNGYTNASTNANTNLNSRSLNGNRLRSGLKQRSSSLDSTSSTTSSNSSLNSGDGKNQSFENSYPDQSHHLHHPHQTISSTTILPPSSIRDIIALIFVLLALPEILSCIILTTYILSGSSRSFGGRLIAKHLLLRDSSLNLFNEHNTNSNYKSKLILFFLKSSSIHTLILGVFHYVFPKKFFQYLIILAKSIMALELIGASSSSSTTITSITSTSSSGLTTTTTTTTINNGQSQPQSQSQSQSLPSPSNQQINQQGMKKLTNLPKTNHENNYFSTHILNSIICFISVVYINYIIQEWIVSFDFIYLKKLAHNLFIIFQSYLSNSSSSNFSSNLNNDLYDSSIHFNHGILNKISSPFHITHNHSLNQSSSNFMNKFILYLSVKYLQLSDPSIHYLSTILRKCSFLINNFYWLLCIHVISLTFTPLLNKIIVLKDYSKTLDHLSSLTPNVPLDFRNKANSSNIINHPADSSNDPIIVNVEQNDLISTTLANDIYEINVNPKISKSNLTSFKINKLTSVAANNFETFCVMPFTNKVSNFLNLKYTNNNKFTNLIDNSNSSQKRLNSNPSTMIVDKDLVSVISVQPFWSLLASAKIMFKNPSLFAGESTKFKNNGGKFFNQNLNNLELIKFSTILIDDTKVIFQALDLEKFRLVYSKSIGFEIIVNGVSWPYVEIYDSMNEETENECSYICIYGLTPLFQYEIDIYYKTESESLNFLSHSLVNTISGSSQTVLNKSPEITSLMTLQSSLISAIDNLNNLKSKFKKTKKDENKKNSDLKKDIDNLKNKIDKYNTKQSNHSNRSQGKLKGLQHWVLHIEEEIASLTSELNNSSNFKNDLVHQFKIEESKYIDEIKVLEAFINEYDSKIGEMKNQLKAIDLELQLIIMKNKKLKNKENLRIEEINKINSEIKLLKKNGVLGKINKRSKKIEEKFENTLPKIIQATTDIRKEFEESVKNE